MTSPSDERAGRKEATGDPQRGGRESRAEDLADAEAYEHHGPGDVAESEAPGGRRIVLRRLRGSGLGLVAQQAQERPRLDEGSPPGRRNAPQHGGGTAGVDGQSVPGNRRPHDDLPERVGEDVVELGRDALALGPHRSPALERALDPRPLEGRGCPLGAHGRPSRCR